MKCFKLIVLVLLLVCCLWAYLFYSGRASYFVLNKRATIYVNGKSVPGEMLQGRATAIVTRRDVGNEHSYYLFFAGDVDQVGDMGTVVDCNEGVAPRFPLLLETRRYPPCKGIAEDGTYHWRWPLIYKGGSMEFVTGDQTIITIKTR